MLVSRTSQIKRSEPTSFRMTRYTHAWKELDIDVCAKNRPISRPIPQDPAFTMLEGEEKKWARSMVELQTELEETSNTYYGSQ